MHKHDDHYTAVEPLPAMLRMAVANDPADQLRHRRETLDPHCEAEAVLAQRLDEAPWRRLALVGDSIVVGLGDPIHGYRDASWAERVAAALDGGRGRLAVRNLGVVGARAAQIRAGQLEAALAFEPDLAVVTGGGNDLMGRRFDVEQVEGELETMIAALTATGCLVITFGVLDFSRAGLVPQEQAAGLRRRIQQLNDVTAAVTSRHGGLFVNCFDHPAQDDGLFSADGIHPNRRGHAVIATEVVRTLDTALARHRRLPVA